MHVFLLGSADSSEGRDSVKGHAIANIININCNHNYEWCILESVFCSCCCENYISIISQMPPYSSSMRQILFGGTERKMANEKCDVMMIFG